MSELSVRITLSDENRYFVMILHGENTISTLHCDEIHLNTYYTSGRSELYFHNDTGGFFSIYINPIHIEGIDFVKKYEIERPKKGHD